jgi:hypothetical protein
VPQEIEALFPKNSRQRRPTVVPGFSVPLPQNLEFRALRPSKALVTSSTSSGIFLALKTKSRPDRIRLKGTKWRTDRPYCTYPERRLTPQICMIIAAVGFGDPCQFQRSPCSRVRHDLDVDPLPFPLSVLEHPITLFKICSANFVTRRTSPACAAWEVRQQGAAWLVIPRHCCWCH